MRYTGLVLLLLATGFLLSSCIVRTTEYHYESAGNLKIINNTNSEITVTWSSNHSQSTIGANSERTFEFDMKGSLNSPNGISTSYTCDGLYLHSVNLTDEIYEGQTTIRTLYADRGCLRFVNNTAGPIDITIPGINYPMTLQANSTYTQAWLMPEVSGNVSFSYFGDFVFSNTGNAHIYLNSTGIYQFSATGAAIKVRNYSSATINEVYISLHSDTSWGENDLSGTIAPGNYIVWTVSPNQWDVQVVDVQDYYGMWTDNDYISLNEYLVIDYDPSKLPPKNQSDKLTGSGSLHVGNSMIQQQRTNHIISK